MRWGRAEDAGFAAERLAWAWAAIERAAGTERVPGAVAVVGRAGVAVGPRAFGFAVYPEEAREPVRVDTPFDLASLTKVVGTATACWALVERGLLRLAEPVAALVPGFATPQSGEDPAWRRAVAVRHLLTHTAGLPAHRDLRPVPGGRSERLAAVSSTVLRAAPGEAVQYSDLGFILLGEIVAQVAGRPLDALCHDLIFEPLGMMETGWNPAPPIAARAAATEWAETGALAGHGGFLRGVVHDENARVLGGLAGHAGLFAPAHDLAVFADMVRAGGRGGVEGAPRRILSPATVAAMSEPVFFTDGDSRTRGWQGGGRLWPPFGDLWSERVFGHTGFTGTSLWIDPARDLWAVLLTNAVHMGRDVGLPAMPRLRACFHNAVVAAAQ